MDFRFLPATQDILLVLQAGRGNDKEKAPE
jgi:hypothetical protein